PAGTDAVRGVLMLATGVSGDGAWASLGVEQPANTMSTPVRPRLCQLRESLLDTDNPDSGRKEIEQRPCVGRLQVPATRSSATPATTATTPQSSRGLDCSANSRRDTIWASNTSRRASVRTL